MAVIENDLLECSFTLATRYFNPMFIKKKKKKDVGVGRVREQTSACLCVCVCCYRPIV